MAKFKISDRKKREYYNNWNMDKPSKSKQESLYREEIKKNQKILYERVSNAELFIGSNLYPSQLKLGLKEGEHYKVLAYTDWADTFVPTVVEWKTGEIDDFSNNQKTRKIISKLNDVNKIK